MRALLLSVLLVAAAGCAGATPAPDESGRLAADLRLTVTSSPTCPVETTPPDPACAPRPVAGAQIRIEGPGLDETIAAGADGVAAARLEPGDYTATPLPVDGLMGTADPFTFTIGADYAVVARDVRYDTGIR
jgi:hypothetical protein